MRTHRLALTTLAAAGAVLAAGCGTGKDTGAFLPADPPAQQAAPPMLAPGTVRPAPVIVGGPSQEVLQERDAAAEKAIEATQAAQAADERRREARRELREEREQKERAHKRAEAREARLREALADARKQEREDARPAAGAKPTVRPAAPADPSITGSDTGSTLIAERNARHAVEARAAVIRFHELMDRRDTVTCDLLTANAMTEMFGAQDGAHDRCRQVVTALTERVTVTIAGHVADGGRAIVDTVTHYGETDLAQRLHLVLVNGTWMIDRAERRARR